MFRVFILGQKAPGYLVSATPVTNVIFGSWLTLVYRWKGKRFIVSIVNCKAIFCVPNKERFDRIHLEFNNTVTVDGPSTLYFAIRRNVKAIQYKLFK